MLTITAIDLVQPHDQLPIRGELVCVGLVSIGRIGDLIEALEESPDGRLHLSIGWHGGRVLVHDFNRYGTMFRRVTSSGDTTRSRAQINNSGRVEKLFTRLSSGRMF
jgi:hypothetical protein